MRGRLQYLIKAQMSNNFFFVGKHVR